jgi:hypothetical protein
VSVFSWTSSEDELKFYTQENAHGNHEKTMKMNANKILIDMYLFVFGRMYGDNEKFPRLCVVLLLYQL